MKATAQAVRVRFRHCMTSSRRSPGQYKPVSAARCCPPNRFQDRETASAERAHPQFAFYGNVPRLRVVKWMPERWQKP